MDRREELSSRMKTFLRQMTSSDTEITEETKLSELGMTSFHIIAMIFDLKQEYGQCVEESLSSHMPNTFGEVIARVWDSVSRSGKA
jgi:acyl carrier protein